MGGARRFLTFLGAAALASWATSRATAWVSAANASVTSSFPSMIVACAGCCVLARLNVVIVLRAHGCQFLSTTSELEMHELASAPRALRRGSNSFSSVEFRFRRTTSRPVARSRSRKQMLLRFVFLPPSCATEDPFRGCYYRSDRTTTPIMLSLFRQTTTRAFHRSVAAFSQTGTVKWFDSKKGFGFITADDTEMGDIFVHQSVIHSQGFRSLAEGEPVEFSIVTDEQGRARAENVTGPMGAFVMGQQRLPRRGPDSYESRKMDWASDVPLPWEEAEDKATSDEHKKE